MDYGGHGSKFFSNLIITKTSSGDCIGLGPMLAGLGDSYYNNSCALPGVSGTNGVGGVQCDPQAHKTYQAYKWTLPLLCVLLWFP